MYVRRFEQVRQGAGLFEEIERSNMTESQVESIMQRICDKEQAYTENGCMCDELRLSAQEQGFLK